MDDVDLVAGQDVQDALRWFRCMRIAERSRNRFDRLSLFPQPP